MSSLGGDPSPAQVSERSVAFALVWDREIDDLLIIDGAHGEGGGQILRTALSLSAISGRPFRLINIRAHRHVPGLLPQHLSATRAAAAITGARLSGDQLGSSELIFVPRHKAKANSYVFDVAEIAGKSSAGSAILVLQSILVPLALAQGASTVLVKGGTHQEWAPSFDDFANAYLPALRRMGLCATAELKRWGWYPTGGGEVACVVAGASARESRDWLQPIEALERGPLIRIGGRAVAANLPSHIPQRMSDRACATLSGLGVQADIEPQRVTATCPGAGIFLSAGYASLTASFSAFGRQGKPSETVADEAVAAFREHHASGAVAELHLADQLLVPLAIAAGSSTFTVARPTTHLYTNAWTIEQFGLAKITIEQGTPSRVQIHPEGLGFARVMSAKTALTASCMRAPCGPITKRLKPA